MCRKTLNTTQPLNTWLHSICMNCSIYLSHIVAVALVLHLFFFNVLQCRVHLRWSQEILFYCAHGWILDRVASRCYYRDRWYTRTFHRKKVTCGKYAPSYFNLSHTTTTKRPLKLKCQLVHKTGFQCCVAHHWICDTSAAERWLTFGLYCSLWSTGHTAAMAGQQGDAFAGTANGEGFEKSGAWLQKVEE